MAGLEDGLERITRRTSPLLQTTSTSRSARMHGGEDCLVSGSSRRRWTRSQSPLRQLLSTASRSRSTSPANGRRGGGGGDGGGDSEEDCLMGATEIEGNGSGGTTEDGSLGKPFMASMKFVGKMGAQDKNGGAAVATESDRTMLPDGAGSAPPQEQQQLQPQHLQQRVCLKNVLHPVSYDECHTPTSEEGQAGEGGSSGGEGYCDEGSKDAQLSSLLVASAFNAGAAGSSGSIVSADGVSDSSACDSGSGISKSGSKCGS